MFRNVADLIVVRQPEHEFSLRYRIFGSHYQSSILESGLWCRIFFPVPTDYADAWVTTHLGPTMRVMLTTRVDSDLLVLRADG
jgi:hypothetical protein